MRPALSFVRGPIVLVCHLIIPVHSLSVQSETKSINLIPNNRTVYSTNPTISYHPESQCTGAKVGSGCGTRYDPWESSTYKSPSGTVETIFRTSSWQNQPNSDQIRHMYFGFRGSAIYIYGAPRNRLQYQPGPHEVCLDKTCTPIDAAYLYANSLAMDDEPVLLWSRKGLDPLQYSELRLRLRDSSAGPLHGLTFHHLVLTENLWRHPNWEWDLPAGKELYNVSVSDTNPGITYAPPEPYKPWEMETYFAGGYRRQSFHHTSSRGNTPGGDDVHSLSWMFQGRALYVYGAPKNQLQYEPGGMDICVGGICYPIDAARIYLNIQDADEPVLLYSNDHLDPTRPDYAIIRLLQNDSPLGVVRGMTFLKAIHTGVRSKALPAPGTSYIKHRVLDSDPNFHYLPREACSSRSCSGYYNPWEVEEYPTLSGVRRTYYRTSTWLNTLVGASNRRIAFSVPESTSSIEIYGAPRPRLLHPHGKQEICLDDACYPIDIEQAYLNIEPDMLSEPVLVWSNDHLDHTRRYTLVMKLLDRTEDGDRNVRGMTFSELVFWEVRKGGDGRPVPPRYPSETTSTVTGYISTTSTSRSTSQIAPSSASSKPATTSTIPPISDPSRSNEPPLFVMLSVIIINFVIILRFLRAVQRQQREKRRNPERDPLLPHNAPNYPKPPPSTRPFGSEVNYGGTLRNHFKDPSEHQRLASEQATLHPTTSPLGHNWAGSSRNPISQDQERSRVVPSTSGPGGTTTSGLVRHQLANLSNSDIQELPFDLLVATLNGMSGTHLYSTSDHRPTLERRLRSLRDIEKLRVEGATRLKNNQQMTAAAEARQRDADKEQMKAEVEEERRKREEAERRLRAERQRMEETRAEVQTHMRLEKARRRDLEDQLLQERRRMEEFEHRRRQEEREGQDRHECVICQDNRPTYCLLDCGHMCVCGDCSKTIIESDRPRCPICRANVRSTVRVFGP